MSDRRLDRANVLASPQPLFRVCDFLRRTYLEYIIPLLPKDAPLKVLEVANPFLFNYPDRTTGVFVQGYKTDPTYLAADSNWPTWTANQAERFSDSIGRNVMIAEIILQKDAKGQLMMGGTFDFEPTVVELARGLLGEDVAGHEERMQDARKAVGLAG